ncbi:Site-specific recombinase XerC [Methylobacterium sp. 190mf]|uniref:site-specific integrase n=1 Tax=Methylobacterium sp. 190mf TaxID=1761798 RepID=UPI00089EF073|nr:tyrosine-type recombinase/integrase [Methylobacterium sp. 190mf]SEG53930.1 Site-specific recombinase XerC [Methylobacterium sp. 190mf]
MISELPGVNIVRKQRADGTENIYYYHRATKTRLTGLPGTVEFRASYAAAQASIRRSQTTQDVIWLIRRYTDSPEFNKKLALSTQREYRRMLTTMEPEFGDMPVLALQDHEVITVFMDWRDKVATDSGERESDNRLSVLSAMLTWAKRRGHIHFNHVRGFERLHSADRSEVIWLPEHIEAFMSVAPLELQRALMLALHTGQRQADILGLEWSAYDGKNIWLRQGKNARHGRAAPLMRIPCTEALRGTLDGMDQTTSHIVTTKSGRSFGKRHFARTWHRATREAQLDRARLFGFRDPVALHFHDLRGTAITLLSEVGSTPQEIAAITGHKLASVTQILDRYMARSGGLADRAIERWEKSSATEYANRLQTRQPSLARRS